MTRHLGRLSAAIGFLIAQAMVADAAELKVYATIAVQSVLEELAPKFEQAGGHKLAVTWGTAAMMVKRVQAGEQADVLILTKQGMDALVKDGKVAPGSVADIASAGTALVVKKGAPKPDISTPEAFKQTLLAAKSIAYSNPAAGGASGVYVAKLLERMGIADEMKAKTKFPPAGGNSANLVVSGEAELAIQQKPEVMAVPGVEIVGVLPGDLNNVTAFTVGIGSQATDSDAAKALIKFLQSPDSTAVFKAKGLDPA